MEAAGGTDGNVDALRFEATRKNVARSSTERLISELLVGQNVLKKEQLVVLERGQIMMMVIRMRILANSLGPIGGLVPGFQPSIPDRGDRVSVSVSTEDIAAASTVATSDPATAIVTEIIPSIAPRPSTSATSEDTAEVEVVIPATLPAMDFMSMFSMMMQQQMQQREQDRIREERMMQQQMQQREQDRIREERMMQQQQQQQQLMQQQLLQQQESERIREEKREAEKQKRETEKREEFRRQQELEKVREEKQEIRRVEDLKRQEQLRAEETQREMDREAARQQLEERKIEIKQRSEENRQRHLNSITYRVKGVQDSIKGLLTDFRANLCELPFYFERAEKVLQLHRIADDLYIPLIQARLPEQIIKIIINAGDAVRDMKYPEWKELILKTLNISPIVYKELFDKAKKEISESYVQYVVRVKILLAQYLRCRSVRTFEQITELLVADKVRSEFRQDTRVHVLHNENNFEVPVKAHEIASYADRFEAERLVLGNRSAESSSPRSSQPFQKSVQFQSPPREFMRADKSKIQCHRCLKFGHVQRNCTNSPAERRIPTFPGGECKPDASTIRRCFTCGSSTHLSPNCPNRRDRSPDRRQTPTNFRSVRSITIDHSTDHDVSKEDSDQQQQDERDNCRDEMNELQHYEYEAGEYSEVNSVISADKVKVDAPILCQVSFAGHNPVTCRLDSGADISLLSPKFLPRDFLKQQGEDYGKLKIKGVFSDPVEAQVVVVDAALVDSEKGKRMKLCKASKKKKLQKSIQLLVAITDSYKGDVALLTRSDYAELTEMEETRMKSHREMLDEYDSECEDENDQAASMINKSIIDYARVNYLNSKVDSPISELLSCIDLSKPDIAATFARDQREDSSLTTAWKEVEKPDSGYFKRPDGLLSHRKRIGALSVARLVLPLSYRSVALDLAHASIFACHLKDRKTLKRLEAYFYWPSIIHDVRTYIKRCSACQMIAPKTKRDRVPIAEVERAIQFGDMVNIDLIGPFKIESSSGHSHVLTLVDSCTRWPEAEPIKNLKAEEVCKALMRIFIRIGIPRVVVADNGTNMVADLTQKFCKSLGIELRHSTPYHPQGNALVERLNGTIKKCITHVIMKSTNPRSWHEKLPYVLFAIRETPCETTGLAPFSLVYGRLARGPLAVLSDSWTNAKIDPSMRRSDHKYLSDLREVMAESMKIAEKTAESAQERYVNAHNKNAVDKEFQVGDLVLVLQHDSSNKLLSEWQGPGTITSVKSAYSYSVAMPNGAVRIVHANLLRRFYPQVSGLGVMFEDEEDFGNVVHYEKITEDFDEQFRKLELSHLSTIQREELYEVLFRHRNAFNDKPGSCNTTEMEIKLRDDLAEKKQPKPYRVPEKLKPEVIKQVQQLLEDKKIRPSTSQYQHPLVCVIKKDNSVRMCTDLRYINTLVVNDAYPIPISEELLMRISGANFISTLDCTSGYFQIPVHEDSRHMTAFVAPNGLFEWCVLPFGLKTASAVFSRVMDEVLRKHKEYSDAFIDDTAVFSMTWREHLNHLDAVLTAFEDKGMTLKMSKCVFGKAQVKYLGHMVGSNTRSVVEEKVTAIKAIAEPHTKKLLRSFLGMCNFYRSYVPNYAEIAAPLTDMTKKGLTNDIRFDDRQRAAFIKLKESLCNATTLHKPDYSKFFIIRADASDYSVGASLAQLDDLGVERPISFMSCKLNNAQTKMAAVEKEAYAIIVALQKFGYIVFGGKIIVYSDSNPLRYVTDCAPKSSKLTRWSLALARYDITVKHVAGRENIVADFFSRC